MSTENTQFPDLDNAAVADQELAIGANIDYSRKLSEYATIEQIVAHLRKYGDETQHVYTETLNEGGKAVQNQMENYLGASEYYSSGQLKKALVSPLHLYYEREQGWKEELEKLKGRQAHFELGDYLHQCILEPTKFSRVVVEPKFSRASTQGVESLIKYWEGLIQADCEESEENANEVFDKANSFVRNYTDHTDPTKLAFKKAYLERIKMVSGYAAVSETHKIIIDIVKRNYNAYAGGIIPRILKHSKREISMFYNHPNGLKLRIRPDAIAFEENIGVNAIISVKSTRAEDLGAFQRQAASMRYELSEGMYQDVASAVTGRDFNATIMIMLQTTPPYGVAMFLWNPEDIEIGKYKYQMSMQTAIDCEMAQRWPGYESFAEEGNFGLIGMKLPNWTAQELPQQQIED